MENNETEKENSEKKIVSLQQILKELEKRGTWNFILMGFSILIALLSYIFVGTLVLPFCSLFILGLVITNGFNVVRLAIKVNKI